MKSTFRSFAAKSAVLAVAAIWVAGGLAEAQEGRATINGVVADQSGAAVAGAAVTAREGSTGQSRAAVSSENGTYVLPLLPPGTYTVTCSHAGFATQTHSSITITVGQQATVDCTLSVGEVNQSVEVSASAEQINTTNGALAQVIEKTAIEELPLNGRNPATLVFLSPGATDGLKTGAFTRQDFTTFPTESGASVSGGRQGSTYYMLDGGNNMDSYTNLALAFPNPDATQEFQVITNNFDAQYGFSPGAVVSIVTRSGTNSWHGDGFEFLRNDVLNARDFFAHTKDSLKRNQFGASAGGKILKDKLFIFGNYQGTTERYTVNGGSANVPSNANLNGDFSSYLTGHTANLCGAGGPSNLNFDTGQLFQVSGRSLVTCPAGSANAGQQVVMKTPFPGNRIPTSLFSPIALRFEDILPRTDDPGGLVTLAGRVASQDYQEFTLRPDWYVNEKNHISGRVYYNHFSHPPQSGGGNALLADRSWTAPFENYGGSWLYTIKPTLINNLVVSYNRLNTFSQAGLKTKDGKPVCYACFGADVAEYPTTAPALDLLNVNGTWIAQNTNLINRHNVSIADSVTWTHGQHMIVAGINVLDQFWEEGTDWLAAPLIQFQGKITGNGFADFLLGQADSFEQGAGEFNQVHGTSWAGFVQDTYRMKPNFTLNFGVRWEPFIAFTPSKGRIPIYAPGQQSTRYPNAPLGLLYPGDAGVPSKGTPDEWPIFSPRISMAWQPGFLSNTSVRASFGIFAVPFEMSYYNHAADTAPFSPTYSFDPTTTGGPAVPGGTPIPLASPWSVFEPTGYKSPFPPFASPDYAPPGSTAFITPVNVQSTFSPDFKLGKTQTWNVSLEHQFAGNILARAAYVGSESYHLSNLVERNPGIYSTNPTLSGQRALSNYSGILQYDSWGTASYNALQLTFEKRFSRGLQFTANYTWSKNIDSASASSAAFNGSITDPFNIGFDRGISSLNYPRIFNAFWVYQTPMLKGYNPLVRGVFGNWELSGTWRMQSGDPFSISGGNGNDNSQSHVGSDRADVVSGQSLNVRQGSKSQWLNRYFNTAAFTQNAPGTFGNSARNSLQGPGVNNVDMGINKNFPFGDHYRVQFRWEMFNALNRPTFDLPNTTVTSGSFGQISQTKGAGSGYQQTLFGYTPRVMQAALKFYW